MEYEKENKKDIAKGIRFNGTRLKIAMSKANKKSAQQLVDFLLERFVNGENPVAERQQEHQSNVPNYQQVPPQNHVQQQPLPNQLTAYAQEMNEARSYDELKAIVDFVNADDSLGKNDKIQLNQLAGRIQQQKVLYQNG